MRRPSIWCARPHAYQVHHKASTHTDARSTPPQLTSYGNVNLVNENLDDLEADYNKFHEIVGQGIFKVVESRYVPPSP